MRKYAVALCALLIAAGSLSARAQTAWQEGKHYFAIQPAQRTAVPAGKIEIVEVFSYGCPACDRFQPIIEQLKGTLPPNAEIVYVPHSFNPSEQWPLFQRAFFTAQTLGIAEKTHKAMFDAVWKTGELAVVDQRSGRIKNPPPTIEDVAKFYARTGGLKAEQVLAVAKSFAVEAKMKGADQLVKAYRADVTPTMIVNGKYRLTTSSAGGVEQTIQLINWLVARETK
jgi:protein dithiol oxidoreductase (disulfide-forming)